MNWNNGNKGRFFFYYSYCVSPLRAWQSYYGRFLNTEIALWRYVIMNANFTIRRNMENETRKAAIGGRWLLSKERRKGKTASSVVLFFYETVAVRDVFVRGRKHKVEIYDWNRKGRETMEKV